MGQNGCVQGGGEPWALDGFMGLAAKGLLPLPLLHPAAPAAWSLLDRQGEIKGIKN